MKNPAVNSLTLLLFVIASASCTQKTTTGEDTHLGNLQHSFSISEQATEHFDQGLLLLHSFEYDDANEAFQKAIEADPDELMAHWGLAMTHYRALWGLQDVEAGRKVIQAVGETREARMSKAENQLEAAFWEGVEILYGEGELDERNQRYADHMAEVYAANPDNQEVAAFYALGLMWAGYTNQDNLNKSAEVAAGIIAENPTHPGALHYMIHANDDPEYAQIALTAADKYATVAPDASHALHMPSHIYVALGMWDKVVSSNIASYQASLHRMEAKGLGGKERGYHAMAWLHYGYLQTGEYQKAADLLAEIIAYHQDSTASKSYLITMQNEQRIEAGYWPEELTPQQVDYSQLGLPEKSAMHFFNGMLAFDEKDATGLQLEIDGLNRQLGKASLLVNDEGIAMCSAGPTRYAPTKEGLKKTQVVIHQMEALLAQLKGDNVLTEDHLTQATQLESECSYDSGPPFIAYPSFEQYGDWLLAQNRPEEALTQFNQSLSNRKNRNKALRGKVAALEALGRTEEAKEVKAIISQFAPAQKVAVR
ncbi:MAG: tetratricopeptide repeat protein [Imperialibacter sp.]|uniref:tetratricopeptide repeat protein n=1 Tax=Imperialibacter sp. TaxID=2038411 RepID=UPI0032ECE9FC